MYVRGFNCCKLFVVDRMLQAPCGGDITTIRPKQPRRVTRQKQTSRGSRKSYAPTQARVS